MLGPLFSVLLYSKQKVLFVCLFVFWSFVFIGSHPWHMDVPRLGVQWELQPPAYTTATATWDLSCVCNLYHSSQQCQILNPLSKARDRTRILTDTSQVDNLLSHNRNSPKHCFCIKYTLFCIWGCVTAPSTPRCAFWVIFLGASILIHPCCLSHCTYLLSFLPRVRGNEPGVKERTWALEAEAGARVLIVPLTFQLSNFEQASVSTCVT